ncbi:MAG: DUF2490 domain-containing protein [Bacteroidota bacterium]
MKKIKEKTSSKKSLLWGRSILFVFFFLLFCGKDYGGASFAQSTNDAGLWATFNVQKELKKNVSVFITEECRLRENFSRLNLFYTDLGVAIRPFKFLKVSLAYRMIDKFLLDNTFSYRHRLMLDITLKKKSGAFSLSYRQRLQSEVRNVYSSASGTIPEWYSRNKFELKYDMDKPVRPYIAAEFRYQINDPRNVESEGLWHRNRYIIGLDYKKNDRNTFGVYYLIQNEFNVSAPENIYIVGLEYTISL